MEGNSILIKHALSNLIQNYIKYNINGEILLSQVIEGNKYKIAIADTGIGIKEENTLLPLKLLYFSFKQYLITIWTIHSISSPYKYRHFNLFYFI